MTNNRFTTRKSKSPIIGQHPEMVDILNPQISFEDFLDLYFPTIGPIPIAQYHQDYIKCMIKDHTTMTPPRIIQSRIHEQDECKTTSLAGIEISHIIMDDLTIEPSEEDKSKCKQFLQACVHRRKADE